MGNRPRLVCFTLCSNNVGTTHDISTIPAIPGARIMGQDQTETGSRAATIAFTINGMRCSDAVKRLVEKRIAVRNGRFYALRSLEALGIEDPDVRGVPGNRYSYRESRVNSIY